jgi:hypothetical protein
MLTLRPWQAARDVLLILLGIVLLSGLTCVSVHHWRHPAPLGRSTSAMESTLDAALPLGTSVDSVVQFLRLKSVAHELHPPTWYQGPRATVDTAFRGGPVVLAFQRDFTWDSYRWDAHILFYFGPDSTLRARRIHVLAVNPL